MKIKTKIYSNRQKNLFKLLQCVAWYTLRELGMKTEIKEPMIMPMATKYQRRKNILVAIDHKL